MDKETLKKYLEILELDVDTNGEEELTPSLSEIKEAYQRLKALYTSEAMSMVTEPIEDEFSQEDQEEILNQLEEAYNALLHYMVEKDRVEKEAFKKAGIMEDTVAEYIPGESREDVEEEGAVSEEMEVLELPEVEELLESQELIELPEVPEIPEIPEAEMISEAPEAPEEPEEVEEPQEEKEPEAMEAEDVPEISEAPEKPGEAEEREELEEAEIAAEGVTPTEEELQDKDLKDQEPDKTVLEEFEKFEDRKAVASTPGLGDLVKEGKTIKGRTLRRAREKLEMGIHEMAVSTGISYKVLVNIEKERYSKLPEPGYLRWLITTYAKSLSLDPQKAADDYMKRYRQWQRNQEE
jgi:hypothetical protein